MSCVLRADGGSFDVDAFLAASRIEPCKVWHRGERRSPRPEPSPTSGFNADVSEAGFDDLSGQVRDAIAYLGEFHDDLIRLLHTDGVEGIELDFAIAARDVAGQFDFLPPELIRLAAECGMGIEL